jgi:GH18 family chitinase
MRRLLMFVLAAAMTTAPAPAKERGVVIGYIAAFKGLDREMQQSGLDHYTHLDLAFVNPTPAAELLGADGLACSPAVEGDPSAMVSDRQLRTLIASAHRVGTKVIASLGGAVIPPCGGDWAVLLAPASRAKLVGNLIAMVERYDLDGIDLDLEGDLMAGIDASGNYTPFVRELAAALHARSKLLTAATGSYPGGMVPDASLPYFDLIGVMAYDAVGPTWGPPGGEHSPYSQAEADLRLWIGKGVPAAKLALGMPFYGRGFGSYRQGWNLQDIAAEFGDNQLAGDVVGKRCGGCDYITFNGLPTLERKARLAGAWGAGVMVWEVGQDLPDGRAIRHVVNAYREGKSDAKH